MTRDNAGKITGIIDGRESVDVVGELLGVRPCAGGVREHDIGELLRRLDHVSLMTEAVREDDIAALVDEVGGGVIALGAFGDVPGDDKLGAERIASRLRRVDEVLVISAVLVVQADETEFETVSAFVLGIARRKRDRERHHKRQHEHECQEFLLHKYLRILCLSALLRVL